MIISVIDSYLLRCTIWREQPEQESSALESRKRVRKLLLGLLVVIFAAFAVWDFWDSYVRYHSILMGVLAAVAGTLFSLLYSGWPSDSSPSNSEPDSAS